MCNPTSQPPRRDLYELETSMRTADNGPSFLPKKPKPPRIGGVDWDCVRPGALAIYNADYMADGTRYEQFDKPWTVIGGGFANLYERFHTHAEAIAYAFKKAEKQA